MAITAFKKGVDRLKAPKASKVAILAKNGTGKTAQCCFLPPEETLFIAAERGEVSLGSWEGAVTNLEDIHKELNDPSLSMWEVFNALVCLIAGPTPAVPAEHLQSAENYNKYKKAFGDVDFSWVKYLYIDSMAKVNQFCYDYSSEITKDEKNGFAKWGALKDEFNQIVTKLQSLDDINVVVTFPIFSEMDSYNNVIWDYQLSSAKSKMPVANDFDQIILLEVVQESFFNDKPELNKEDFKCGDGLYRVFVTRGEMNTTGQTVPNLKNRGVNKDGSRALKLLEPANIKNLLNKIEKTLKGES